MSKRGLSIRNIALLAVCAALLTGGKFALSALPNIEIVTLLLIVFTQRLRWRTLWIIYVFVLTEGLIYGFHMWWIAYLYVWTALFFAVMPLRDCQSPVVMACVGGGFGLLFGSLCSIPYLFTLGPMGALSWIVSGLSFDLIHCAANFVLVLLLYNPLTRAFRAACPRDLQAPFPGEGTPTPQP